MWLMKCAALMSRSLRSPTPDRPLAKVVLSVDPPLDNSSPKFTMELFDSASGNAPKSYAMDVSKDFVPMSVFSKSFQGKFVVEGKILNKFDMRPSEGNLESSAVKEQASLDKEQTNTGH